MLRLALECDTNYLSMSMLLMLTALSTIIADKTRAYCVCLDWLISRRQCSQNWPQMIVPVREKINSAIQDMPAVDDVANLLRGTCVYIITIIVSLF